MAVQPKTIIDETMRSRHTVFYAVLSLLLCFGIIAAGLQYQALTLPQNDAQKIQTTDALVVTTGGQSRISTGLALMEAGAAQKMLVTGVGAGITKQTLIQSLPLNEAQAAQLLCCVDLDFIAADTVGNAAAASRWMQKNQFESLRLVTANYHIDRAILEFKRHMPDLEITYFAVSPPDLDPNKWYYNWPTARLFLRELGKYFAAQIRHFTTARPVLSQNPS